MLISTPGSQLPLESRTLRLAVLRPTLLSLALDTTSVALDYGQQCVCFE